ncbi:hypothetical protein [Legionella busanensis]|uniref:hypothetical protein n=1 Tax=Legionella busanensis TaxID=190655 RepID=UPI000E1B91B4|nr:hypothetical protein [Legionella busanensis]
MLTAFNEKLNSDVSIPLVPEDNDIRTNLDNIKTHIMATNWKVGDYWLFKERVKHGDKRVPHRVNDILNLIKQVDKKLDPKRPMSRLLKKRKRL